MTSTTVTATDTFNDAVKYALERVGKAGMVLKSKQVEAIRCVYEEKDVFLPTGSGRLSAPKRCPFYSITNTVKLATQVQRQEG